MKEINALILNIHTIIKKGVNMPLGFIGEVLFFLGWAMATFGLCIRVSKLENRCKKLEELYRSKL